MTGYFDEIAARSTQVPTPITPVPTVASSTLENHVVDDPFTTMIDQRHHIETADPDDIEPSSPAPLTSPTPNDVRRRDDIENQTSPPMPAVAPNARPPSPPTHTNRAGVASAPDYSAAKLDDTGAEQPVVPADTRDGLRALDDFLFGAAGIDPPGDLPPLADHTDPTPIAWPLDRDVHLNKPSSDDDEAGAAIVMTPAPLEGFLETPVDDSSQRPGSVLEPAAVDLSDIAPPGPSVHIGNITVEVRTPSSPPRLATATAAPPIAGVARTPRAKRLLTPTRRRSV